MIHLVLVSLIWAFSFGIIGNTLAPVPSPLVSAIRLILAFLLFAPFFKRMAWRGALFFVFLGGVQFGAMYLCYNESFKHLESHQVALLTLTTPIFIALLEGFRARKISARLWLSVWVATLGVGIIVWHPGGFSRPPLLGLLLIQLSNLCFAFGQWAYRNRVKDAADRPAFSWMYLGAALVALPFAWQHRQLATELEARQIFALLYLGLVASGLCFFMWNLGARRVTAARMAVMNDLKIPLGILASVLVFKESPHFLRLAVGVPLLVAAIWLGGEKQKK